MKNISIANIKLIALNITTISAILLLNVSKALSGCEAHRVCFMGFCRNEPDTCAYPTDITPRPRPTPRPPQPRPPQPRPPQPPVVQPPVVQPRPPQPPVVQPPVVQPPALIHVPIGSQWIFLMGIQGQTNILKLIFLRRGQTNIFDVYSNDGKPLAFFTLNLKGIDPNTKNFDYSFVIEKCSYYGVKIGINISGTGVCVFNDQFYNVFFKGFSNE